MGRPCARKRGLAFRAQLANLQKRLKDRAEASDILAMAKAIDQNLTAVEEALHQTKARSPQDMFNYPIRLNNKLASLAGLVGMGDSRPTDSAVQVKDALTSQVDAELANRETHYSVNDRTAMA